MQVGALPGDGAEPWFGRRPVLAAGVAVMLFVAVFVLRLAVQGTSDGIALLFVLPIALLAVAFGRRVGILAGAAGVGLVVVWVAVSGVSLTPLGWVSRATPMLLLGVLVGAASDRLRDAVETERRLAAAAVREREAAEINDGIVQRLVASKWSLEGGDHERSLDLLTESIEATEALVADLLDGRGNRRVVRMASAAPARRR